MNEDPMTFSAALWQLKDGQKMTRQGWNGANQWVALYQPEDTEKHLPYLYIRTVTGHTVPWLASQTDILAEDWTFAP